MSALTLDRARAISDALAGSRVAAVQPLPIPEATVLPPDVGWDLWDLAVAVLDFTGDRS